MNKKVFLKYFKIFYLEFIIIVIGILLTYIFTLDPIVFIVIALSVIIGGGFLIFGGKRFGKRDFHITESKIYKIWGYIKWFLSSLVFLTSITLITLILDIIYFLVFGVMEVSVLIAFLIITTFFVLFLLYQINKKT